MRNALAKVGKGHAEMVAAAIRTIFTQPTGPGVRAHVETVAVTLDQQFPAVAELLRDSRTDITAFADFPEAHWRKIWSTNPLVIWGARGPVLHVRHEGVRVHELRPGSGYLPQSMRQIFRRNDACSAGPLARRAA